MPESTPGEKLSIYPQPPTPLTLIETPHPLSPHIRTAREATSGVLAQGREAVEGVVGTWVGWERAVEREVKSVLPKDEPLTPGILYIGVAGLAGSVVARNRNILVRLLLPPTLILLSSPYFLPQTSHNVRAYLSEVEDTHFPAFAAEHTRITATASAHFHSLLARAEDLTGEAKGLGDRVVKGVEGTTGLRLGEVMKGVKSVEGKVLREYEREKAVIEEKARTHGEVVGVVLEQKPIAQIIKVPEVVVEEKKVEEKRLV